MKKYTLFIFCLVALSLARGVSAKESCQITLSSTPVANTPSSFIVSGTLESNKESSGCAKWTVMENSIGVLSVYDGSGQKIAGPVSIKGPASSGYPNYAYPFPITFSQTITLDQDIPAGAKIVLSDYGENDTYEGEEISTKTVAASGSEEQTIGSSFEGFKRMLKYGMKKDSDVVELQKVLKKKGFFTGEATGDFGPKTKDALKKYQKSRGLQETGGCGPKTRIWLNEDL